MFISDKVKHIVFQQKGSAPERRNKKSPRSPEKKSGAGGNRPHSNLKITPPDKNGEAWKRGVRTSLLWVIILGTVIILAQLVGRNGEPTRRLTFTEYKQLLDTDKIESGKVIDNKFFGTLKEPEETTINGITTHYRKFVVVLPFVDTEVLKEWDAHGVAYDFKDPTRDWVDYLFQMLPWMLLIVVWFILMRRMQGASTKGIFSFGKSRAKIVINEKPEVTFRDVAGCDEAKEELREIVSFLKHPARFQRLGGKIPKGALLVGPPGTGKTLLARAVAGEAGVPFYSLSGADFVEMFVGVGASRVRDLFEQGKKNAPCIIFIDEIDAVGRQRGAGLGGGHDEREQTLNALLVEMDGFETTDNVILLAATNRPDVLDSALLRPGRFDRRIVVDIPDVKGREEILKVHAKKIPLARNVRLDIIAKGTPGMVGADLANLLNEAALLAARKNKRRVGMEDIEEAKDKVMMGIERRSMVISEKERRTTAYHEAGHALVAKLTPEADPVHKVTIVPRGRALGLTAQLPVDDRHNYSKSYLEGVLTILMGGRIAEREALKQLTTGAGNDLERATALARKMVCEWGMSDHLGPMTFGKKQEEIFIGRELGIHRDFSEDTARRIDEEVRRIIEAAESRARKIIRENRDKLDQIAQLLLEKESISGSDIDAILSGNGRVSKNQNSANNRSRRNRRRRRPKNESAPQLIAETASSEPQKQTEVRPNKQTNEKLNPPVIPESGAED